MSERPVCRRDDPLCFITGVPKMDCCVRCSLNEKRRDYEAEITLIMEKLQALDDKEREQDEKREREIAEASKKIEVEYSDDDGIKPEDYVKESKKKKSKSASG